MKQKTDEFITLKEAAKISGYTQDYLGQLIRQGKLEGSQVFSSVSWVTTPEALERYMGQGKSANQSQKKSWSFTSALKDPEFLSAFFLNSSRVLLVFLVGFLLFLFGVAAITIDDYRERITVEKNTYE